MLYDMFTYNLMSLDQQLAYYRFLQQIKNSFHKKAALPNRLLEP